jgi:hypothetical protein
MDIAFKSLYIKFTYKNNIQLMTSEKAEDLPVRTRRPRVLVQAPEPVPVVQTPVFVPVVQTPVFVPVVQTPVFVPVLMTSETDTDFLTRNNGSSHTQYEQSID